MMDIVVEKASLWRETLKALKSNAKDLLPIVLAFGAIYALFMFLTQSSLDNELTEQMKNNPNLFKQHPEFAAQQFHRNLIKVLWLIPYLLTVMVAHYVYTVAYLRVAMKNNRPNFEIGGFFYWLGQLFLKYLRVFWLLIPLAGGVLLIKFLPAFWGLLPLAGFLIYLRSIIRYQLVSPLAALRRAPVLRTSWNLTKGNWWRLLGNLLLIDVIIVVPLLILLFCFTLPFVFGTPARSSALLVQASGLLNCFITSVMSCMTSVFSCVAYRFLSQEVRQAVPPADANSLPST